MLSVTTSPQRYTRGPDDLRVPRKTRGMQMGKEGEHYTPTNMCVENEGFYTILLETKQKFSKIAEH